MGYLTNSERKLRARSSFAKEDLAHIFERFYKGRKDAKDSAGIGLAMAKQVILRQNGTIHAESEEGKGSTFIVRLYSSVQI